jgi:hypothetical protein
MRGHRASSRRSHARLFREAPPCWLKPRGCKRD